MAARRRSEPAAFTARPRSRGLWQSQVVASGGLSRRVSRFGVGVVSDAVYICIYRQEATHGPTSRDPADG